MSRQEKNKVYNTIGLSPSLSMPAKGDANSTTSSAVARGTIEIRENPTQDISALSRDTANSLNELGRIFDKQKIEDQQDLPRLSAKKPSVSRITSPTTAAAGKSPFTPSLAAS